VKYSEFINEKTIFRNQSGFEIELTEINPMLKPHQKDIVKWCVIGGCRSIFASFGLGKTFCQLEILRIIKKYKGGRMLVIAPLGVRGEFFNDSKKLDIEINFVNKTDQVGGDGLYITNYESVRDGKLDVNLFNGVSLDEASVLRSYGSKTYQNFLTLFESVKYKFVATATPSPNKYKELIHYAGFLGISDTGQALTRFFKRDSTQANNLTLHPHKEAEFWLWLSTWALFLQKPSDLGYSDEGYELPELKVIYHKIKSDREGFLNDKYGQGLLFPDPSISLTVASSLKRDSISVRVAAMMDIINNDPDSHYILWHDQEAERKAIKKALPECKEIYGSQKLEIREKNIADFSDGGFKYLATKPVLSGSGCNLQRHCHKAIFLGIGFKFNDFIQSCHRIHRFLQKHQCEIHIIYIEEEMQVLKTLTKKWENHVVMVNKMAKLIKKHGLSMTEMSTALKRATGVERIEKKGKDYIVANNDCVEEAKLIEDNSIGLIVTSIPFSNHYEYSPNYNDFGHTDNNDHFWQQMDYLTPELYRTLKPGRIYACHVKDRILFGNVTGAGIPTVSPFHMEATFHAIKHGFDYCGMITVVTDVVRENNQTYRLGWTEQCKDASKMGVGSPEYILLFHKPQTDRSKGFADEPVKKSKEEYTRSRWQIDAHAFWKSSGDRFLHSTDLKGYTMKTIQNTFKKHSLENIYDYETHLQIGENLDVQGRLPTTFMMLSPESNDPFVWTGINRMHTLNGAQTKRKQNNHICPLQIGIADRLIERFSNKGDVVYDPFGGLMTVPLRALKLDRKGRASELNTEYFIDGVRYLEAMEREKNVPTLFDFEKEELKGDVA